MNKSTVSARLHEVKYGFEHDNNSAAQEKVIRLEIQNLENALLALDKVDFEAIE